MFFIAALFGGIVVSYIFKLHESLDFANKEHIKLLNGMHEGLLILTNVPGEVDIEKQQRSLMFCN